MADNFYVSTCTITYVGDRRRATCQKMQVSQAQIDLYAEQLKDYLLVVYCSNTSSYDNSDDERAECSSRSWGTERYYEFDVAGDSKYLIVDNDKVIGVKFVINEDYRNSYEYSFLFDGSVQETFRMGYSASHSSCWTYINRVLLVKKGENGAPQKGGSVRFEQTRMYPSF